PQAGQADRSVAPAAAPLTRRHATMNAPSRRFFCPGRLALRVASAGVMADAASKAQQGGEAVSKVLRTMGDVATSSKKIADIIGVIDGIAFQTDILAPNAAVEAA